MESEKSPLLGKRSEDEPKSFDVINNDKAITSTMYKENVHRFSRFHTKGHIDVGDIFWMLVPDTNAQR